MTSLVFSQDAYSLPQGDPRTLPVLMYGCRPPVENSASIGSPVLAAVRRLGVPVHPRAFDLLTVAMAVTAADTFVDRETAPDGWCRGLHLELPLADPVSWQAVLPKLRAALHFLSGDQWSANLVAGGPKPPSPQLGGYLTKLKGHDCASLLSGGLDSTIGVLDLLAANRRPALISHSYRGDAARQAAIRRQLPVTVSQFAAVANPVSALLEPNPADVLSRKNDVEIRRRKNDVQMRTRSFNFLAYGALVAATMADHGVAPGPVELHVPENGLIAINPPLTLRRIGSLSTRTTHPHFLGLMQQILDELDIPVRIVTQPYNGMTKGTMINKCGDQATLAKVAALTVSCGKWKRSGVQCGRCVPCIIRRAAFHGAGLTDTTVYAQAGQNLNTVLGDEKKRDDLVAMLLAVEQMDDRDVGRWIAQTGPLPTDRAQRDRLVTVTTQGMREVADYLDHLGLLP